MNKEPVKYQTRSRILQLIRDRGPITRPVLARRMRMTRAAISLHVNALIKDGLVEASGYEESAGGRMPASISLIKDKNCTLGISMHDRELLLDVADFNDNTIMTERTWLPPETGQEEILLVLDQLVEKALRLISRRRLRLRQILIGIAGGLGKHGVIIDSLHFPSMEGLNLRDHFYRTFDIPCDIAYSAHFSLHGILEGNMYHKRVGILTWSTGLEWSQGDPDMLKIPNTRISIYSWKHMPVNRTDGRLCYCGERGCLEAEYGGRAIIEKMGETGIDKYRNLSIFKLAELAEEGDEYVVKTLSDAARAIGYYLSPAVLLFDPVYLRVVTCIGLAPELLIKKICEGLTEHCLRKEQVGKIDFDVITDLDALALKGIRRMGRSIFTGK